MSSGPQPGGSSSGRSGSCSNAARKSGTLWRIHRPGVGPPAARARGPTELWATRSSLPCACSSHSPPWVPDRLTRTSGASGGASASPAANVSGSQRSKNSAGDVPGGGRSATPPTAPASTAAALAPAAAPPAGRPALALRPPAPLRPALVLAVVLPWPPAVVPAIPPGHLERRLGPVAV